MTVPLEVKPLGNLEIEITRSFAAPRQLAFDAWTKPELLRHWLGVFDHWTLPLCEVDLRAGGAYRYTWRNAASGAEMTARGVFREGERPARLVATERFDDPWYPGEGLDTLVLEAEGEGTLCALTMKFETKDARDGVLASPMDTGIEKGFVNLDCVFAAASPSTSAPS